MSMRAFVRTHRSFIDSVARRVTGDPGLRLNDTDRAEWVANDEGLYLLALSLGVSV